MTSPGGTAGSIPDAGQIWFGSSFDTSTFAVAGTTTTATVGQSPVLVAHLTRSIGSGDANYRVYYDSTMITNQALPLSKGSGELYGSTLSPLLLAGTYKYEITDVGGNVLASGTLTVTQ